jgi:hypothetical protein
MHVSLLERIVTDLLNINDRHLLYHLLYSL